MSRALPKIVLAFYGDWGSGKAKAPRFMALAKALSGRAEVDVYCRSSLVRAPGVHPYPVNGVPLKALGALARLTDQKFANRNVQEEMLDVWLSRALRRGSGLNSGFFVPGFHRAFRAATGGGNAIMHGVMCAPELIRERVACLKGLAAAHGLTYEGQYLLKEADRAEKALQFAGGVLCSSKAVALNYDRSIDPSKVHWLAKWLQPFGGIESGPRVQVPARKQPVVAFVGKVTLDKGILEFFRAMPRVGRGCEFRVYGPVDFTAKRWFETALKQPRHASCVYKGFAEKGEITRDVDVVVVPSDFDAEPRVIREFLSAGKVVVASAGITVIDAPSLQKFDQDANGDSLAGAISQAIDVSQSCAFHVPETATAQAVEQVYVSETADFLLAQAMQSLESAA